MQNHDDFEIKSKIYSLNCLSCFIHILNCKMSLFFGLCFSLYFLTLLADRGFHNFLIFPRIKTSATLEMSFVQVCLEA